MGYYFVLKKYKFKKEEIRLVCKYGIICFYKEYRGLGWVWKWNFRVW